MSDKHERILEINKRLKKLSGISLEQQLSEANDRIKELSTRLEISPQHNIDGIDARDETIRLLDAVIDEKKETISRLCDALLEAAESMENPNVMLNMIKRHELENKYRNLVKEVKG